MNIQKYENKYEFQVKKIIEEVTSKWERGWRELISKMFFDETHSPFLVNKFIAVDKEEVLGVLAIKKEICASVIYFLATKKSERGRGIGSAILKEAEKFAKKTKCSFLRVDVYDNYGKNKKFYKKNGFKESGSVKNYYELGDSQTFFFKKID